MSREVCCTVGSLRIIIPLPIRFTIWVTNQTAFIIRVLGWNVVAMYSQHVPTVSVVLEVKSIISVYEVRGGINVIIIFWSFLFAFGPWENGWYFFCRDGSTNNSCGQPYPCLCLFSLPIIILTRCTFSISTCLPQQFMLLCFCFGYGGSETWKTWDNLTLIILLRSMIGRQGAQLAAVFCFKISMFASFVMPDAKPIVQFLINRSIRFFLKWPFAIVLILRTFFRPPICCFALWTQLFGTVFIFVAILCAQT